MALRLRAKDWVVLALGLAVIASGVLLALLRPPVKPALPPGPGGDTPPEVQELPQETAGGKPVLRGFMGDLKRGGQLTGRDLKGRDVVEPFVIGDSMKLQVDAHGVTHLRWVVNGKALALQGDEWMPADQPAYYDIDQAGTYAVDVEGRDKDGAPVGALHATVNAETLKILSFEPFLDPEADRYLTGSDLWFQVDMVEPLRDIEYEFRYLVNGKPVKNPENGLEWSDSDSFPMAFEHAGSYRLAVEVRRAGQTKVEARAQFDHEIVVGDALLDSVDALPEDASVGSEVTLQGFVIANTETSQCRFGVKDLRPNQEYVWLKNDQGEEWGDERRIWIPAQAGNFRIRVEVRADPKHPACDAREILYVVTRGAAEF